MTIRILNTEASNYSSQARLILQSIGDVDEHTSMSRTELIASIHQYDIVIVRLRNKIDREIIDAASSRLKFIVTATTGLDHIEVDYARLHGIEVLNLREQSAFLRTIPATAEHTWALLLALTRRIPWAFSSVLRGEWDRDRFRGHDLKGKTLGILGLGRIGCLVASYGLAFGMQVQAYDPSPQFIPEAVTMARSMAELFSRSDILTIHIPLSLETENLVGAEELSYLAPHAVLINTSRGKVLDEQALCEALEKGAFAGAAVDVIVDEHGVQAGRSQLLITYAQQHSNLLITPHIGGATYESMAATEVFMAQHLKARVAEGI